MRNGTAAAIHALRALRADLAKGAADPAALLKIAQELAVQLERAIDTINRIDLVPAHTIYDAVHRRHSAVERSDIDRLVSGYALAARVPRLPPAEASPAANGEGSARP